MRTLPCRLLNKSSQSSSIEVSGKRIAPGVSSVIGGMGLAVGGTAVGIGMFPVATAGAVAGLAVYGIKKVFEE